MSVSESKLSMLSPTGKSRMWDASADGYARGEGVASVVLKRLSDAIADNDPIECVIRATGVNQDGRSMGITMPSSQAQKELIRSTYAKAGLDLRNGPENRPQYFESHGTGTPAGDPQEASAIYDAFFSSDLGPAPDEVLHVGSIKTIIGHTEGTAGLAGLIKASLSLQHGTILPNMHLQQLNPKIAPLISHLRVPIKALPWPPVPPGMPKRASVNSFGFGGTNAHAILESYESGPKPISPAASPSMLPFAFSAASEQSLGLVLESYMNFLQTYPLVDLIDLAWSLYLRKAALTYRFTISASSVDDLLQGIEEEMDLRKIKKSSAVANRAVSGEKRILGIFTGQGAAWPQMGLDLLNASPEALGWFTELQVALDSLPVEYRPNFKLIEELSAPKDSSRLHQALISQSLCTAVQIVLVRFLQVLKIKFSTVIGHSSGEIAGAYAAGILTAKDAIRIAYLRGYVANSAGSNGQKGAMMAVAMSLEEANALCHGEEFRGRVNVAAANSSSSITLSGDADAVVKLADQLKQQSIFSRLLKVDTAYHSLHMIPCLDAYIQALSACKISPKSQAQAKWFSSVYDGQQITAEQIDTMNGHYWGDNMVKPVFFSQALTAACQDSSFDMIIEVGPHPALKGPSSQTLSELREIKTEIPYTGLLNRGSSGIKAISNALGHVWTYLGANVVDVESYVKLFDGPRTFNLTRDLPTYPFDRSQSYYPDTRALQAFAHRDSAPHQLLGSLTQDTTEGEWRWRNFLRREEIDWYVLFHHFFCMVPREPSS